MYRLQFNKFGSLKFDVELTLSKLYVVFSHDKRRIKLLNKAKAGFQLLVAADVETIYIGGSFASTKKEPKDIDGVFIVGDNFNGDKLPDNFLDILNSCGMDFYPAHMPTNCNGNSHLDFFKIGREDESRGLIKVSLKELKCE